MATSNLPENVLMAQSDSKEVDVFEVEAEAASQAFHTPAYKELLEVLTHAIARLNFV